MIWRNDCGTARKILANCGGICWVSGLAEQPLTDAEVKALRELVKADQRRQWLLSSLKSVAGYIAVLAAGYLAFKGLISDVIGWAK